MMNAVLNPVKNAPQTAFDASGCSDALENALRAASARFLPPEGWCDTLQRLESAIWDQARALVSRFNAAVGEDVLCLMEFADMFVLFGRPDAEAADKRLLWGFKSVDELSRLVLRLQKGMEVMV